MELFQLEILYIHSVEGYDYAATKCATTTVPQVEALNVGTELSGVSAELGYPVTSAIEQDNKNQNR